MQLRALTLVASASVVACGPAKPDFDWDPEDSSMLDARVDEVARGVRILSDVALPRERDASNGGSTPGSGARDAGIRDAARADAAGEAAPDASGAEVGFDASSYELATCAALASCVRAGGESQAECLRASSPAARALFEPLTVCETERCPADCDPSHTLFECDACLLGGCPSSFIACMRESGCGDGLRNEGTEACDDGNADNEDDCTNACTAARCGDGIRWPGREACDDGNATDSDACLATCRLPFCGDGFVRAGVEGCDDGNVRGGDGCSAECHIESCGNGLVEGTEECDEGRANADDAPCLATCRINRCGDGKLCADAPAGCGQKFGTLVEECDDANASNDDSCPNICRNATCGDGYVERSVEQCDDGNDDPFDSCSNDCRSAAAHLLITEVVTRPSGAEFVEVLNPTRFAIDLSDYLLTDSHLYYKVAFGGFTTSSGSDFAARFPPSSTISPGQYKVVALANASGGSTSFVSVYGRPPDFELRPTANGAADDLAIPNMQPAQMSSTIGANASLTDSGEPIMLFFYRGGNLVSDVDYLFFGAPSASNPVIDKSGIVVGGDAFRADTSADAQHFVAAPGDNGSIHRCVHGESSEARTAGNGLTNHDETSEDARQSFVVSSVATGRTPGGPPPSGLCPLSGAAGR
ncbi:MAG TPA: DUF4215 domain-containing protein [Polyangiaceae bacterium]